MASTVVDLTKDVWTKVLTNVKYNGQIHILDLEDEPTSYLIALVNTGASAPVTNFAGGIKFSSGFYPANNVLSDYYIKPVDSNGKVVILT